MTRWWLIAAGSTAKCSCLLVLGPTEQRQQQHQKYQQQHSCCRPTQQQQWQHDCCGQLCKQPVLLVLLTETAW
jgi:hypothetical protein